MLGEGCSGVSSRYSDFEIDAVLQQAEQLLGLQKVGNEGSQNYALPFNRSPHVHNIDSSSSLDHKEQVLQLRLALREKDIELLEYKTHLQAVTNQSSESQHKLRLLLEDRDAEVSQLLEALKLREEGVRNLANSLQGYRGLTPEAAAALQSECSSLSAEKLVLQQAASDLRKRLSQQTERLQDSINCWDRVQAELQQESVSLAAALAQRNSEFQDLYQEKEVLRAKVSLLEGRTKNCFALISAPTTSPKCTNSGSSEQVESLQKILMNLTNKLEAKEQTCRKYKEAIRELKRRNVELEQQLQNLEDDLRQASDDRRSAEMELDTRARAAENRCTTLEKEHKDLQHQNAGCTARLAEVEMVLRKLECDQAQWEWRAREAENKANARLDAAQSSHTAAIEAANLRALNAEARSADFESQAKAACLQVLHLEKKLQALRNKMEDLRMQDQVDWQQASDWQHVGMLQQQHREVQRLQDLVHSKQMTITNLQQQIHVLEKKSQQMEATMTDQVNSKTTALKEAEKRFMQLEMVMRRVAGKKQQAHTISATEDFLITTEVA